MPTNLQQIAQNVAQKEVLINQNFASVSPAGLFSRRNPLATGLSFQYYGGSYPDSAGALVTLSDGSIKCSASASNYIEFDQTSRTVVLNTTAFSNNNIPIALVVTSSTAITSYSDRRVLGLVPFGSSGSGGGGSTSYDTFGKISVTNTTISGSNEKFKVTGGKYFQQGVIGLTTSEITIADFTVAYSLTTNTTYYIYLNVGVSNASFNITTNQIGAVPTAGLMKLMYIITTNTTQITSVVDYRNQSIFITNKMFIRELNLVDGTNTYNISTSTSGVLKLKTNSQTVGGTFAYYPSLFTVQLSMICVVAEKGYTVGDEVPYHTGDMIGSGAGAPWRYNVENGDFKIYQGSKTYVWNGTTTQYESPTVANWKLVFKLSMDVR